MKKKTADQKGLPTFKKMIHRMINNQIILMKLLRFKGKNFSRHPHRKKKKSHTRKGSQADFILSQNHVQCQEMMKNYFSFKIIFKKTAYILKILYATKMSFRHNRHKALNNSRIREPFMKKKTSCEENPAN